VAPALAQTVLTQALQQELQLQAVVAMTANNLLLVFQASVQAVAIDGR
jgi:hypothetical protein